MEPTENKPNPEEEIKAQAEEIKAQPKEETLDPAAEAELLKKYPPPFDISKHFLYSMQNLQPFLQGNPNLAAMTKPRIFWDTQPVPKFTDYDTLENKVSGPLEEKQTVESVRKEGLPLPEQFEWCDVNLTDDKEAKEVYDLLTENYVEDDDSMFRFDYSIDFLRWAVLPPNYYKEWLAGVRVKKSKKLVGFITAIPLHLVVIIFSTIFEFLFYMKFILNFHVG